MAGGNWDPITGFCNTNEIRITLDSLPVASISLLQVQNPGGPLSNEMMILLPD